MAALTPIKHRADEVTFSLEDLMAASAEGLGRGTCGSTYKVTLRSADKAVKRLRNVKVGKKEFMDRVEALGAMEHPNIVRLIAYHYRKEEKLLVYDYMPNKSLSYLLHENGGTPLDWDTRSRIILGVARGISYIHSTGEDVSHGNIKSSNILLDESRRACLSDCGVTFLVDLTANSLAAGYIAPGVRDSPKASQKADVYGFGVFLLELLTRKNPVRSPEEGVDLPRWVQSVDGNKWSSEVLDVELIESSLVPTVDEMVRMLQLGIDCTNQNPERRPSMMEVVAKIEDIYRFRLEKWDQEFNQQIPLPNPTSPSSSAGNYKVKFKLSSLLPWRLPNLRSASSTEENHKKDKRKQSAKIKDIKWDGITTFTYSELVQATSNFSKSNELGKGGFGKVYKGDLLCTKVAIKILHREGDASQEQAFRREVDTLCRVSHPHLVQLMGVCPKKYALVYEFMEGGTLEDRLVRKDIPWQDRIRIATEICSALVFLHSRKPDIVVHGDLKPANILLDASGLSKLGDFGICRIIPPSNTTTTAHITATSLQGSDGYMDPVFKQNSKLQPSIDVYAFGMIVLRLLTNDRPGHGLVIDVEEALSENSLEGVLDTTAWWPSQLAKELSDLAVKCCDLHVKRRPHLHEVWEKLEELSNKAPSA